MFTEPFDGTYLTKTNYKGANWTRSYSSPVGKALLTRVTQQSQGVIYSTQDSANTRLFDADEFYASDTNLTIRGSVRIEKDGDSSLTGPDRLYRFVPTFKLILGTEDTTQYFLYQTVYRSLNANMTAILDEGTNQENVVNYHNLYTGQSAGTQVHPIQLGNK